MPARPPTRDSKLPGFPSCSNASLSLTPPPPLPTYYRYRLHRRTSRLRFCRSRPSHSWEAPPLPPWMQTPRVCVGVWPAPFGLMQRMGCLDMCLMMKPSRRTTLVLQSRRTFSYYPRALRAPLHAARMHLWYTACFVSIASLTHTL